MKKNLYIILLSLYLIGTVKADYTNTQVVDLSEQSNKQPSLLDTSLEHIGGITAGLAGVCIQKVLAASMAHIAGVDGSVLMRIGSFMLPAVLISYAKQHALENSFFKKKTVVQSAAIGAFFAPMVEVDQYLFAQSY